MWSYEQTLQYLYASQPAFHIVGSSAYKPGLENTRRLMAHLGNPHERFASVHIAGTNGKGSTSHLIAASLQCAGYRVGLYTSPHLVDYRERIRINGAMIPKEEVVRFVEDNRAFLEEVKPSFFETTMALAFWYFAQERVDIAVVECGLGGRLDSTNIITPILSVITNIGFDHTEFLGDTLAKIAYEKAGIIKPGVPCVIGETDPETMPVFLAKAKECGILGEGLETTDCRIWFADQCGYLRRKRQRDIPDCQLHGIYQEKNIQTAYVALSALSQCAKDERLRMKDKRLNSSDLKEVRSPGRTQCEADLDTNSAAWRPHLHETSEQTNVISPSSCVLHPSSLKTAFSQVCTLTGLRGRWETVREHPLTICDTGHNAHGIKYVAEQLQQLMPHYRNTRIIFGMVADKDISEVVKLLPANAIYYFTQPNNHRAFPAEKLLKMFEDEGLRTQDKRLNSISDEGLRTQDERRNSISDERLRIKDERQNSVVNEGLRIKDERLNSSDYELPRPASFIPTCRDGAGVRGRGHSETKVISPSSCVLHPSSEQTKVTSPSSCVLHPSSYRAFPTIEEALAAAFAEASPDDLIFIGGSNYV
ncbi:MAG: bifunctional folylpolyglutamate synthase/dihydrofolate synthase, partial [Paludibacteraceae bacterium]